MFIEYAPVADCALNVICSVVLLFRNEKPVICERRSTPPGPVKLFTSAAILKLVGSTGALKLKSSDAGGVVCTVLGFVPVIYIGLTNCASSVLAIGDPRPSLVERYGTHAGYVAAVTAAAQALEAQRLLLPADVQTYITNAQAPVRVNSSPVYGSYTF